MFAANAKLTHAAAFYFDIGLTAGEVGFLVGLASGIMVFSQLVTGVLGLKIEMHRLAIPDSLGAPFAGYIRDTMGSYVPAWKIFVVLLMIALVYLIFAKPPKHLSLGENSDT
ncbi:MAG: hypothetical protein JW896_10630 [Deltaproteobacteria bacterium]|nr:hypothetical protein [Deltaproteobacteria bacterium]